MQTNAALATASVTPMSIRLDVTTRDRLSKIALSQKRTSHALAREAINTFIEKKESEAAWNQSCLDAVREYEETGLHVTNDEVMQWLDSWGTENELPPPKCHV